jgi:hypothetical protein
LRRAYPAIGVERIKGTRAGRFGRNALDGNDTVSALSVV